MQSKLGGNQSEYMIFQTSQCLFQFCDKVSR